MIMGFPGGASGQEPTCQCRRHERSRFHPWVGKIPRRRAWQLTLVFLPGKSHGQRSLVGYCPWGHKESDMTEATEHSGNMIKYRFLLHIKDQEGVLQTDLRSKDTDVVHLGVPPSPGAPESPSGRWGRIKGRDGTWLFHHFSLEATHTSHAHIPVGEGVTRPQLTRAQSPGLGSPCPVTTALGRGGQPALLPHTLILRKKHNRFFPYNFLEKAVAPHSSTLAWKIPWTEEPGGLQSMGSLRVRHD